MKNDNFVHFLNVKLIANYNETFSIFCDTKDTNMATHEQAKSIYINLGLLVL